MFRRFLTFVAAAAAAVTISSCQKDDKPTVEFAKSLYTVYEKGSVEVFVTTNEPASSSVTVPIVFSGDAEAGKEYEASAQSVTIAAGETSGSITITNLALTEGKQISLSLTAPAGYDLGTRTVSVVAPDAQEGLVCSFSMARGYVLESYVATIKVTGTVSGKDFSSDKDIVIPLTIAGEGASDLQFVPTEAETKTSPAPAPYAVLKAGSTSATVKFTVPANYSDDKAAILSINSDEDSRFIAGDNGSVSLAVRGLQTPDKLIGTWKFSKVYDLDELNSWFSEYGDDIDALPTHNDGFSLTFSKESDGSVTVTPGGNGDFNNFFRKATVSLTEPKNITPNPVILGKYTTYELNMFYENTNNIYQVNTYYELSSANRAFSSSKETLGKAVVVFSVTDDGLNVEFRDYDKPPFGETWWDNDDFQPEMFGFASLFVKQ